MSLRMQIYDELENELFYALERTIFTRKRYPIGEATNHFRLMTPSDIRWPISFKCVNDAAPRCVINRRSVIWLPAVLPPL